MPIDFKQVAAPSFSDSNTLVALAAKQQQEAMTGIQGAWTGAMDAISNRVQGEMEGIANQASLIQLTDPVQRQALEQEIMAANTLGMGDPREINKYTDGRIGTQIDRFTTLEQEGRNAAIEKDRYDANQLLITNEAETKAINEGIFIASDFRSRIDAAETKEEKDQLTAQMENALGGYGFNQAQRAKVNAGYEKQSQEIRMNDYKEILLSMGIPRAEAERQAIEAETLNSTVRTGVYVNETLNKGGKAAITAAQKAASDSGFAGAINDSGGINYDNVKQRLDTNYSAALQKAGVSNPDDSTTFDEYAINNAEKIDKMGLGTFMRSASLGTLQGHFRWAQEHDAPYTEAEKIAAAEGLMSGAIKMDMFAINPNPLTQNGESARVGKALREQLVPLMESRKKERSSAAGREEVLKAINFLTGQGQSTEEILTNLGITTSDHQYADHLPENFLAAVKVMEGMPKLPDNYVEESGTGKTKKSLVSAEDILKGINTPPGSGVLANDSTGGLSAAQTERMNISANLDNLTRGATAGSGVLANTQDLAAIGNANNVGSASTTPTMMTKPVNKVTNNGYVIPENARTITGKNGSTQYEYLPITTSVAKDLGVKINSRGELVLPANRKNETAYDVYGGKWKLTDADTYEQLLGINNSAQAKDKIKKGNAFIKGTSNYRPPQRRLKTPDPKHPLAHLLSDDPKNFVPYNERNPDGSPIHISKVEKKKYGKFRYTDAHTKFSK